MADDPDGGGGRGPFLPNLFIWNKWGPLPAWAWMAIGIGAAVIYSVWQKNKAAPANDPTATDISGQVPYNATAPVVWKTDIFNQITNPITNNIPPSQIITIPTAPPGGGRMEPPVRIIPNPAPLPPQPRPVTYTDVTVSKYTTKNPPWNSTLWGIAQHILGNGASWGSIWNDPGNATLRAKRGGDPKKIQPGDVIHVPRP